MKIRLSTRRLLVSTLYMGSAVLFITNLATTAGAFTTLDLALTVIGATTWGVAAVHSITRRYQARRDEMMQTPPVKQSDKALKGSTHNTINASLHIASASMFIAGDIHYITAPNPVLITRLLGSFLWLKSAGLTLWLARNNERAREINPDAAVQLCGINPATLDFIVEVEYLAAGLLYTFAIWNHKTFLPLKVAGNFCWLIACTHETIRMYREMQKTKNGIHTQRDPLSIRIDTPHAPVTTTHHNPIHDSPDKTTCLLQPTETESRSLSLTP